MVPVTPVQLWFVFSERNGFAGATVIPCMNPESPRGLLCLLAGALTVLAIVLSTSCNSGEDGGQAGGVTADHGDTSALDDEGALAALVADAPEGGTVLVPAGTYREQLVIDKPLTLKPAGDGPVLIDGECKRGGGIVIPVASNVTVTGIEIRNTIGAGVFIGDGPGDSPRPENVTIDSMTISDYDCANGEDQYNAGIAVFHSGKIALTNNLIMYRKDQPDARGNGNAIWFKSNSEIPTGGGHYIAGNEIWGGWDGIGGEAEDDPNGGFDGDTIIENNVVRECWDDGIQVEGGDDNVIVRGNTIIGCGTGVALAPVMAGPLTIERNIIRDLEVGLYENQFCFKVGDGGGEVAYLTENICETEGWGIMQTNSGDSQLVLSGNCIIVTGPVMAVGDVAQGSSMDGDTMWTTSKTHFIAWKDGLYDSVAELRESTGQERNGRQAADCPL